MATKRVKQVLSHLSTPPPMASAESWNGVPMAPPDAIFKITAAYKADPSEIKVNLGVGAYRTDDNKPWVLPVVKKAIAIIAADDSLDHEYLPITGLPAFVSGAAKLILGDNYPADRTVSVQTISGTGANHLGAAFLSRFYDWNQVQGGKKIYLSKPTWANHHNIFRNVGFEPVDYPYYDPQTVALNFDGFLQTVQSAPPRSIFLLHACAHNPTGVDPSREQWEKLADAFVSKGHFAFFDSAYQGFASGDLDNDAWALRHFIQKGIALLVCQSFAKNAGLYGERVGAMHIVSPSKETADRLRSQLSVLQRSEISNPPTFGARIMALIFGNDELFEEWKKDIKTMANRIIAMRHELRGVLIELKTPGNWDHIVNQIGMFSFTGLNTEQCKLLTEKAHIYLTTNGRISMAGINSGNVRYVGESIDKVVREEL